MPSRSKRSIVALAAKPYGAGDVWVDGIEVPDRLRSDEPTKIAVRVFSPVKTRAEVSLASGGRTLASKRYQQIVAFDVDVLQAHRRLITLGVLALNILARVLFRQK